MISTPAALRAARGAATRRPGAMGDADGMTHPVTGVPMHWNADNTTTAS